MVAKRYFRIWRRVIGMNVAVLAGSRIDFWSFVPAKILRMIFFTLFALSLFTSTETIAGYTRGQVLLFFTLTNFIDVFGQMFFYRGVNLMQGFVRSGDLDVALTKPVSLLFWVMFRIFDIFDLATLPVAIALLVYGFNQLEAVPSASQIVLGSLFVISGVVLTFAITLLFAAFHFWTTELEHLHFLFRDSYNISRFPPEVFPRAVRVALTTVMPAIIVIATPVKAFTGRLTVPWAMGALVITVVWLVFAYWVWRQGLRRYTSASS